jgi:hypothetical protein
MKLLRVSINIILLKNIITISLFENPLWDKGLTLIHVFRL